MELKVAPDLNSNTDHDDELEAIASNSSSSSTPFKEEPLSNTDSDEENIWQTRHIGQACIYGAMCVHSTLSQKLSKFSFYYIHVKEPF